MGGIGHGGLGYMYVLLKQSTVTNPAVCHITKVVNQQFAACSDLAHDDESSH